KSKPQSLRRALAVLGLGAGASLEQVKSRFRKLALRLHPDHNRADAAKTNRFIRIRRAYETIVQNPEGLGPRPHTFLGHVIERSNSERMPYVLHGPRGGVVILVRELRMPAVLYAVNKKGSRSAIR